MDFSDDFWKFDKIDLAFVVFLLFIMVCHATFCAEIDTVDVSYITGLYISPNNNYFDSLSNNPIGYFSLQPGYIYHIYNNGSVARNLALSPDLPKLNGSYSFITTLNAGDTYNYLSSYVGSYLYFNASGGSIVVTSEKITDMNGVVTILSNDVGTNQFWNVFTIAIPFILVVVVVVFGFFIVRRLTKKESKGDIRF